MSNQKKIVYVCVCVVLMVLSLWLRSRQMGISILGLSSDLSQKQLAIRRLKKKGVHNLTTHYLERFLENSDLVGGVVANDDHFLLTLQAEEVGPALKTVFSFLSEDLIQMYQVIVRDPYSYIVVRIRRASS